MINQTEQNKNKFIKIFPKIVITLLYIAALALFLYLPQALKLFFTSPKTINVYAFTDMISQKTIQEFTKQTGISVNMKYLDTNEELWAKFKIDKGEGYDLITISDYTLELLKKENLLQKIDLSQIPNFKQIDKRLLGHYFDPENEYCLPYFWSIYGIVYKKKVIEKIVSEINWDLVFKKHNFKICMLESPAEIFFLTSIYLFGKTQNLNNKELSQIKNLLIDQKNWVEIYMLSSLQYYLFGNVVPVAVSSSAFVKKILETSDEFEFVVPKEGSIVVIDTLAIPKLSKKTNLVHKFINFVLSKENMLENSKIYGYNPANLQSYTGIDKKFLNNQSFFPDDEMFKKLHIIHNQIDARKIEKLWFEVRIY